MSDFSARNVCMCVYHVGACFLRKQKTASEPPELEPWVVVNHHVSVGNCTRSSVKGTDTPNQ